MTHRLLTLIYLIEECLKFNLSRVTFDKFVVPACLHVGEPVDDSRAYATGWGYLGYNQDRAAVLQNVNILKHLNKFKSKWATRITF